MLLALQMIISKVALSNTTLKTGSTMELVKVFEKSIQNNIPTKVSSDLDPPYITCGEAL